MNDAQRLQLQNMISTNNVDDQTQLIRQLKHSAILRTNIASLMQLKEKYKDDLASVQLEAMVECNFLFTYYFDLFNKIKKDEIDMSILYKFIDCLESIELGKKDQHEASFEIGTLLKQIYIDSALKKAGKLEQAVEEYKGPQENISWTQWKKQQK